MSPTAASFDHPWMKDSSDPVVPRPCDGGQLDGVALRDAEPAGGNLAQADLPVPQTLPEPVTRIGRLIQRLCCTNRPA